MATYETECIEEYLGKYEVELLLLDICSLTNKCGFKFRDSSLGNAISVNGGILAMIATTSTVNSEYVIQKGGVYVSEDVLS